jgi:hypothetical protein
MLTIISAAKPSRESGIIQRNALQSRTFLHPDVEIVLFGDDEGCGMRSQNYGSPRPAPSPGKLQ